MNMKIIENDHERVSVLERDHKKKDSSGRLGTI